MASGTKLEALQTSAGQSLIEKVGPHATKVMIGAAAVGLVAAFLPAVTVTMSFLGTTASESAAVWRDWRGKLDILGYVGVGVMAGMMLRRPDLASAKRLALACLITSGVVLLLAVWLPLSISGGGDIPKDLARVSIGFGCYLNILAALALAGASALQAKRAGVF